MSADIIFIKQHILMHNLLNLECVFPLKDDKWQRVEGVPQATLLPLRMNLGTLAWSPHRKEIKKSDSTLSYLRQGSFIFSIPLGLFPWPREWPLTSELQKQIVAQEKHFIKAMIRKFLKITFIKHLCWSLSIEVAKEYYYNAWFLIFSTKYRRFCCLIR